MPVGRAGPTRMPHQEFIDYNSILSLVSRRPPFNGHIAIGTGKQGCFGELMQV